MTSELPKAYDPKQVEDKWYQLWENENYFKADPSSNKTPYTIVISHTDFKGVLNKEYPLEDNLQDIHIL